jgi:hypothetical protein
MDIVKLQQAIDGIRHHLAAGDRDAAVALCRETMGVDQRVAEHAVEWVAAHKSAAVTQSSEVNIEDLGRQIRQILQAVPGGGMAGTVLRFAGLDLSKIAGTATIEGEGGRKTMHMTLPTMRLTGNDQGQATPPTEAPAGQPARAPDDPPQPVGVRERPHARTVERPRGLGRVGVAILLLVLAALAAAAIFLLRRG